MTTYAGNPGDLHLHLDRAGLDPLKGYGGNPLDHAAALMHASVAECGTGRRMGLRGKTEEIEFFG